jgi:hypothetical protein
MFDLSNTTLVSAISQSTISLDITDGLLKSSSFLYIPIFLSCRLVFRSRPEELRSGFVNHGPNVRELLLCVEPHGEIFRMICIRVVVKQLQACMMGTRVLI